MQRSGRVHPSCSAVSYATCVVDPIVELLATRAADDPDIGQLMAALGPLALQQRQQRPAIHGARDLLPDPVEDGGRHVDGFGG